MSKTACIVNPGRAVRHDRKRHTEGAILHLDDIDVDALVALGDVSIHQPQEQRPPLDPQPKQDLDPSKQPPVEPPQAGGKAPAAKTARKS